MLTLRPAAQRGYADHGWLQSWHSFSFADYYDPAHMGWGNLRVINEDRVAPGQGFGEHGHRDMEIISYVLAGELAHRDSLGHVCGIPAGDVQHMSAGRGVVHSEFNLASEQVTHFLQIWIVPDQRGITPRYQQRSVTVADKQGRLLLLAAPAEQAQQSASAMAIAADARLYAGCFSGDQQARLVLAEGRLGYVHLVRGSLVVNGVCLHSGDALRLREEGEITLSQGQGAEVLVFDLAA
jgi:redox-sensitive bicupin YhaK (pirin superfamily)